MRCKQRLQSKKLKIKTKLQNHSCSAIQRFHFQVVLVCILQGLERKLLLAVLPVALIMEFETSSQRRKRLQRQRQTKRRRLMQLDEPDEPMTVELYYKRLLAVKFLCATSDKAVKEFHRFIYDSVEDIVKLKHSGELSRDADKIFRHAADLVPDAKTDVVLKIRYQMPDVPDEAATAEVDGNVNDMDNDKEGEDASMPLVAGEKDSQVNDAEESDLSEESDCSDNEDNEREESSDESDEEPEGGYTKWDRITHAGLSQVPRDYFSKTPCQDLVRISSYIKVEKVINHIKSNVHPNLFNNGIRAILSIDGIPQSSAGNMTLKVAKNSPKILL